MKATLDAQQQQPQQGGSTSTSEAPTETEPEPASSSSSSSSGGSTEGGSDRQGLQLTVSQHVRDWDPHVRRGCYLEGKQHAMWDSETPWIEWRGDPNLSAPLAWQPNFLDPYGFTGACGYNRPCAHHVCR